MQGHLGDSPGPLATPGAPDPLLDDLTPAQRTAVVHEGGPLLVVAGAGTGKTRVLTRRVAWRIARGTPAHALLAITFTNKAADVLKARLAGLPGAGMVAAGTFHGIAARLLRSHADRIGGDRSFTILDTEDQHRLLRRVVEDAGLDPARVRPADVAAAISHEKNGGAGRPPRPRGQDVQDVLPGLRTAYGERLHASALYDFDDLLLQALRALSEVPDVADAVRRRFRAVLVDEYQDTNGVQHRFLKALVGDGGDLFAVGDPDQSIYRWRGASVRNILRFADDFPGARTVVLDRNYRSTRRILAAAEAVIERNTERYDKRLVTENATGERLLELRARHAPEEAAAVVGLVRSWLAAGVPAEEIAIVYRVNHVSRGIETALRGAGVPYEVVSGVEFFQRREVKDVLAYARLLVNPRDEAAFQRIANVPRRGLGDTSLARVREAATAAGVSVPEAAAGKVEGLTARARRALDSLLACLARLRARPTAPVGPLLEAILEETGYRRELLDREDDLERSRVENVDALVAMGREADRDRPEEDLRGFLERATLVSDADGVGDAGGRVCLLTAHAAKGLEFDAVAVVGAEEGWFPHARSVGAREDVEEERRLFYVAMTRARRHLAATVVAERDVWKGVEARRPSRFWLDVPDDLVETRDPRGVHDRARDRRRLAFEVAREFGEPGDADAADADVAPAHGGGDVGAPSPESLGFDDGPSDAVHERRGEGVPAVGERVTHPHFGLGRLVGRTGFGEGLRVTVAFDGHGTRTLLWSHARLAPAPSARAGGAS